MNALAAHDVEAADLLAPARLDDDGPPRSQVVGAVPDMIVTGNKSPWTRGRRQRRPASGVARWPGHLAGTRR
jgi:hypothetical protein